MTKILTLFALLLLILGSCGSPGKNSSRTQNNSYKKDAKTIHPQYMVFHVSDSVSEVHFSLASRELLYMRPDGITFRSHVIINYRLTPSFDSKEIADSGSVRLQDVNDTGEEKLIMGKFNVRAVFPRSYFLHLSVTDVNRGSSFSTSLAVEKDNVLGRQNFIVRNTANDAPLFQPVVQTGQELDIQYRSRIGVNLFVRYYNREFPLAPPPFSLTEPKPFQYKADSVFAIAMSPDGHVRFTARKKGFYHFQLDTGKRDGLTLYNFGEYFPEVRRADDMVPPLRYITSREEYSDLVSAANKRAAVEKFWLNCSGNTERGKEIIRKFYNRVQDANKYFSSYLEGWKTDRGMVYLIYGTPSVIYRTANTETWIYGEENNINSPQYLFSKVNNPFTDNDYSLERSTVYKQGWYMAVDIWRQGRTYLQD